MNRAVALAPKDPWAHFQRGMVKFALEDYQQAVADLTAAIRLNPEGALFYFARGQIYYRHLNQPEKGLADFRKGCRLGHSLSCRELEMLRPK